MIQDRYWNDFCNGVGILDRRFPLRQYEGVGQGRRELIAILDKVFATSQVLANDYVVRRWASRTRQDAGRRRTSDLEQDAGKSARPRA
jgi:hypothetical protein